MDTSHIVSKTTATTPPEAGIERKTRQKDEDLRAIYLLFRQSSLVTDRLSGR